MPSANEEEREWARSKFGSIDVHGPEKLLKEAGYTLHQSWYWTPPTPKHIVTDEEARCLSFLIDEWDYGGLVDD